MTHLSLAWLRAFQSSSPEEVWRRMFEGAWEACSPCFAGTASEEIVKRDRAVGSFDLLLATAGWDLWSSYLASVRRTSVEVRRWWDSLPEGRALLVLDALSLRELPWLLGGARERGYKIERAFASGAELPADTNAFAKALGFQQRSALQSDRVASKYFRRAKTLTENLPWEDCAGLVDGSSRDWIFWHHWPDDRVHALGEQGKGIKHLVKEVAMGLQSDGFWLLVERLARGRRLVITSDHGYAVTGDFGDVDRAQVSYLRKRFGGKRFAKQRMQEGDFVPPLDLILETPHGDCTFVLGRRKWSVGGGHPTLSHGGLSLLEVAVPFIELSRETDG